MKATVPFLGALALALALSGTARADHPYFFGCGNRPHAPDALGPGYMCTNYCGCLYGPNYCVRPPWPPFQGMLPPPDNNNDGGRYMTHPYARSPRDFFMISPR
jgi:hypothetical protein